MLKATDSCIPYDLVDKAACYKENLQVLFPTYVSYLKI